MMASLPGMGERLRAALRRLPLAVAASAALTARATRAQYLRLAECPDVADAALHHKDVLYTSGDRAVRLLTRARTLGRAGHRAT